jgi:hypothetical protein
VLSKETEKHRLPVTPTPLPPPPRLVSEDPRHAAAERPKRIFIAVAAGTALLYVLMTVYGGQTLRTLRTVQGQVVRAWVAPGIKGTQHMLAFEYQVDGRPRSGTEAVDKARYDQFVRPDGQFIPGPIEVHVPTSGRFIEAWCEETKRPS